MLNRFKNALYGSSDASDETVSIQHSVKRYYQKDTSGDRRNRLTRSSSFREDLLSNTGRHNNNNNNGDSQSKKQVFASNQLDNNHSQNSYSFKARDYRLSGYKTPKVPKFAYSRPEFLQLKTEDEILVSADHEIRPIILPRDASKLPWKSGYAECINSGKSLRNEDQAAFYQDVLIRKSDTLETSDSLTIESQLPWVYFGIFDGHAGDAVAVAAATQLHNIIGDKLQQVVDLLIALEFDTDNHEQTFDDGESDEYLECREDGPSSVKKSSSDSESQIESNNLDKPVHCTKSTSNNDDMPTLNDELNGMDEKPAEEFADKTTDQKVLVENSDLKRKAQLTDEQKILYQDSTRRKRNSRNMIDVCRNNISVDSLIIGALESAFWEMDALIAQDKLDYKMPGGCTAVVGLFILGKLYVSNAGDSRAIVYKNNKVIPMSFDFTPTSERERVLRLGQQRPEFLGTDFTHLEFLQRPTREDLGKPMLYKDAYMTGWSMKLITYDDLKFPLVWGEGKRSRVLATIGVTRGFGDHELRAQYGSVLIKPFLTPEPEVKVLPLEEDDTLTPEDVLLIGTDGLWDVTSNKEAAEIVKNSFDLFPDNEESRSKYRYITAAQDLVIHSRGQATDRRNIWQINEDKLASLDDIAVFVIPLKQYRDEYLEWKKLRSQAKSKNDEAMKSKLNQIASNFCMKQ